MSVGHVARAFEAAGIPNAIIMSKVFRDRTAAMSPPRVLLTRHPMGRPVSAPFDVEKQRGVLKAGLELLDSATEGGTIIEYEKPYRTGPFDN
ncbi:MAG: hypothetical protein QF676_06250 [Dehalococcoidia bacterium]|nr:hypothetical protein [Dehalococcoidia bacterium]MDP7262183.1 hypothetical protein [Dehalococcoidia bacterium]MDP7485651.1 hypothetical protein [Dehalococcoidia bacterium]